MRTPLNGNGHVGPMGTFLHVTVPGRQWGIAIPRIDMDSDAAFGPFHGTAVTEHVGEAERQSVRATFRVNRSTRRMATDAGSR